MTAFSPTVAQVLAALADAKAYWDAQDVELFLFGAEVDAEEDATLFAEAA